jgi:hypothetical protein
MATMEGTIYKGSTQIAGGRASFTQENGMKVGDAVGRYVQSVEENNVFIGGNLAGTPVTTQAGLSATTPALTLHNPITSQINVFLLMVSYAFAAAPAAAASVFLARNLAAAAAPTLTTLADVTNAKCGPLTLPTAQCARVATLAAAPLGFFNLGGTTGAAAISGYPSVFDLGGIICLQPGVCLSIQTSSAASLTATFVWAERPVA